MATTVLASLTVPWIREKHRMDLVTCTEPPPGYTVTAAFTVVLDSAGRTLVTRVGRAGRGWELPGGHLEDGETPAAAAARELAEETGLELPPSLLHGFGGQRITVFPGPREQAADGDRGGDPASTGRKHRYPPRTFMAFHTVRLTRLGPVTTPPPTSECLEAQWVDPGELARRCAGASWLPLHAWLRR